jgi:hypothetical protein
MINLFNGRVVLERRTLVENWRAKVKLPKQNGASVVIDLQTTELKLAFVRAQNIYRCLKKGEGFGELDPPPTTHLTCWDCVHWSVLRVNNGGNGCEFQFPEARQTAYGKFAAQCHLYDDGTENSQPDRL